MKTRTLWGAAAVAVAALTLANPAHSAVILGGDFQLYKPGSTTVTEELTGGYVPWSGVIPPTNLTVGGGSAIYSDSTTGATVDLVGWTKIQGDADVYYHGPGDSMAISFFGAWGGNSRIVTAASVGTIGAGLDYTISAMIGGPGNGPISGPLAFHLLANGVELTPDSSVNPDTSGSFQTISRTYGAATLAGVVGQQMTIVVGVANGNDIGDRVIFDDVSLTSIPEPSAALLGGLGVLALLRRRRK